VDFFCFPLFPGFGRTLSVMLGRGEADFRERLDGFAWPLRYAVVGVVLFMTLVLGAYGHGFDARQFIYNLF